MEEEEEEEEDEPEPKPIRSTVRTHDDEEFHVEWIGPVDSDDDEEDLEDYNEAVLGLAYGETGSHESSVGPIAVDNSSSLTTSSEDTKAVCDHAQVALFGSISADIRPKMADFGPASGESSTNVASPGPLSEDNRSQHPTILGTLSGSRKTVLGAVPEKGRSLEVTGESDLKKTIENSVKNIVVGGDTKKKAADGSIASDGSGPKKNAAVGPIASDGSGPKKMEADGSIASDGSGPKKTAPNGSIATDGSDAKIKAEGGSFARNGTGPQKRICRVS